MATNDELYLTPYQQIMAQMTPTTNPYLGANVAIGGYDPALFSRRVGSGLINLGVGGGGGGGSEPAAPSAWSSMTPAQQAAYYAANPTMAAITQLGQKAFGFTSLGALQKAMYPDFVYDQGLIAMGINPAAQTYGGASMAEQQAMNDAIAAAAAEAAQSYGGASMAEQQAMNDAISQSISDQSSAGASDAGTGYGTGDSSGGFGEGQYNMGGLVDRVGGPNPPGPDDGTGMLQLGEYVIKKSAVKKYGTGLLDMINAGKIPAKKMKSLLG